MDSMTEYFMNDVLSVIPSLSYKPMFGALAIFRDNKIFGMIIDEKLYFKVDTESVVEYHKLGMKPFKYKGKKKLITMPYYEVPEEVYNDKERLLDFAETAIAAAKRNERFKEPEKNTYKS